MAAHQNASKSQRGIHRIAVRPLSDEEVDIACDEVLSFTDELVNLLWRGEHVGDTEVTDRLFSVGDRYGAGGLIPALLETIDSLVGTVLAIHGPLEDLTDRLSSVETLRCRRRRRAAFRLTEAILAEVVGLDGRIELAYDQLCSRPGFVENDLVSVLLGIWQAVVSVGADVGVGISWFADEDGTLVEVGEPEDDAEAPADVEPRLSRRR